MQDIAKKVFKIEAQQILNLSQYLTEDFDKSIDSILASSGKVIVSGMGKSGIIGKKIAATLASTGTPSFFLHPGEAYHGDLGMVEKNDILLLLSNSGETDEVLKLVPFLKYNQNKIISMTSNPLSTLASNTDFHLNIYVEEEACPLQLVPTSSTTTTLVMGDALAVALMEKRNFQPENFAKFHPGGTLGKKLLVTVEMIMQKDNLPIITKDSDVINIVHTITNGKCGLCIVKEQDNILGVITDGDIRRTMEKRQNSFFSLSAVDLMSTYPKTINMDAKFHEAESMMMEYEINTLLVVNNDNCLVGIIQLFNF
jgi:arabinose-5-phosphate isomerase